MPFQKQAPSRDKSTAKRRPPRHEARDFKTVNWLNHPATIVQRAALAPGSLTPQDVLRLQSTVGNRAVLQLPGVDGPTSGAGPTVQRQEEEEEPLQMKALQRQELEEEEEEVQARADVQRLGLEGGTVTPEVQDAIHCARGRGQPLDKAVQKQMGEAMGYDFSGVRVHTDSKADELNQQLMAKAFTTGPDIFFKRGTYEPASSGGRTLIAHELSHVVQQGTGRVSRGGGGVTVRPAGDAFEQEADVLARRVENTRTERRAQAARGGAGHRAAGPIAKGTTRGWQCHL